MTRQTNARASRTRQNFTATTDKSGKLMLIPMGEKTREAATPLTPRIVKCGVFEVKLMVSEGQNINEYKICKRFMKEQKKLESERLKRS